MSIKEPQFRTITTPNAEELLHYRTLMEGRITEQHAGKEWAVVGIKDHAITLQELVRVRPAGMQYAVLQGRMPQDGSKPDTALILFPAWVSATLLCAGICGRVIELTDGSIIEGAVLPHDGTEQDLLDEIRSELGGAQQRVTELALARAEAMEPAPPPAPHVKPEPDENAPEFKQLLQDGLDKIEEQRNNIAELRDRVEELTGVNHQQQRELAAQDQELERLRTLLASIRRMAKKGKA